MSGETLLIILLVGLIAGWLAGQIVRGTGFGLIAERGLPILNAFADKKANDLAGSLRATRG